MKHGTNVLLTAQTLAAKAAQVGVSVKLIATAVVLGGCIAAMSPASAHAQQKAKPKTQVAPEPPKLPRIQDDFADLDDTLATKPVSAGSNDKFISTTLENSRQQYLRALSYINKSDTTRAAKAFEQSIETLNKIADFPKIEENQDFTDLMQSIIDDYETYIQSIDNLSETSPMFVLRDKFFQELDKELSINELTFARDRTRPKSGVVPLRLPESSSEMVRILGMRGVPLQIPMTDNELVQKTVDFFTKPGAHRYFQKWLERAGRWFPMMRRIAKEEGAPEEIIYLSMFESGLNPKATSPAAAVGLWQFIKSTGQMYGLEAGYWVDERRDPEKSTRAAMRHLKDLYNEFGDWELAMAAYNCGVGGVRRAISRSGFSDPSYWEVRPKLPRETGGYVPLYMAAAKVCMNPEAYGFVNIPLEEPYRYDTVITRESLDFKVLAKCAGISVDAMEEYNPELVRSATPEGEYLLKLPPGTKNTFLANIGQLSTSDKQTWIVHNVSSNETLYSIAKSYNVSPTALASANGLTGRKKRLRVGMSLRIPKDAMIESEENAGEALASTPSTGKSSADKSRLEQADDRGARERERREKERADREAREQERKDAREKERADREAREQERKDAREKERADREAREQERKDAREQERKDKEAQRKQAKDAKEKREAERSEAALASIPANSKKLSHDVVQGETLFSIATRYGVRLADLRNWNNIPYNTDKLGLDDKIIVYVPKSFKDDGGAASASVASASEASSKKKAGVTTHRVVQGETLAKIADDYDVSIQDIRNLSGLRNQDRIYVGQTLKVPAVNAAAERVGRPEREAVSAAKPPATPRLTETSAPPKPSSKGAHAVKKGETPASIARQYGVNLADLLKWNPSARDGQLKIGEELRLYAESAGKGGATTEGKSSKTYTVRQGDTAFSIAKKFGVSVSQLLKLNRGLRENTLSVGQQLRVAE
jgi:membrane-bound lytic murein transglycosylase D